MRGDIGDHLLLIRRYFHRTAEDPTGLNFKQWQPKKGEILVVNSSELRAVEGHQANDFKLAAINPPKLRERHGRAKKGAAPKEVVYSLTQKWQLDSEIDHDTRNVCEGT